MLRPMQLKLFAIAGMAMGLLAQIPHAQAAPAQFELHFRCSPWLYMSEVTDAMRTAWRKSRGTVIPMDVAAVNARLCTQNAERTTYAVNTVFALNGIPATFSYTTEVIAGGGMSAVGLNYRVALFDNVTRDWAVDLINARTPFPDLTVNDVELVRDVDQSTCDPSKVGTADCASLVAATCPAVITSPFQLCHNAAGGGVFGRISPFVTSFDSVSMFETDRWSATTAVSGARRINVTMRYLPGPAPFGHKTLGIAYGLYDRASTALSLNDGTFTHRALTPSNYLPTLGVVTLIAGPFSLFNVSAAPHEIGHVFGALHERSDLVGSPFYDLAGLAAAGYQFANLASESTSGASYDTLMVSGLDENVRLSFSTPIVFGSKSSPACPPGKTCPSPVLVHIGNTLTDNRRYVFETIKWISGDASLALSTPSDPSGNTLGKVMKP